MQETLRTIKSSVDQHTKLLDTMYQAITTSQSLSKSTPVKAAEAFDPMKSVIPGSIFRNTKGGSPSVNYPVLAKLLANISLYQHVKVHTIDALINVLLHCWLGGTTCAPVDTSKSRIPGSYDSVYFNSIRSSLLTYISFDQASESGRSIAATHASRTDRKSVV